MSTFDYIVVGAGSAGCVLASRLSEDPKTSVLLLEAGGSDNSIFVRMPTALSIPMNMERFNWGFESEPEPNLDGRRMDCPRGRVLGGSSSINGMVYVRGHACDFDEWQEAGATGWSYADCLPYFRKSESWTGGADAWRGGDGPIGTCNGNEMKNPLYRAFIEAGKEAGYPQTDDCNGYQQEGFGPMHMTVSNGERCSTSRAYLKPALGRSNLSVKSGVTVDRVIMDGRTATGVAWSQDNQSHEATANAEVIVCAGSIGSPSLLQRSGIGPGDLLRNAGVEVVHDSPGVGANLQDHLEVYFQYRCKQPITLNAKLGLFSKFLIGTRWILSRSGLGATNHFESCAFIRSRAGVQWPDIQFHFLPAAMRYDGRAAFEGHGFQVHVGPNKPTSRGAVRITTTDATSRPAIQFNYLDTEQDREDWRTVLRLTREILGQPAMDPYRGDEIQPAVDLADEEQTDAWVRQNVESAYHPSCTCKMGSDDDPMAVLDAECRVRGIDKLRVIDSSIFPT
ncbi:MAG: choline dehydrogenase, partial [Gammaproteobacteria bacterium]|nr:choline dehydrogenase [Gammaproteobacteria bacterium]